ncbi:MAG: hypothetical protein RLZ25_2059 [Pseudomonadota bacterium]
MKSIAQPWACVDTSPLVFLECRRLNCPLTGSVERLEQTRSGYKSPFRSAISLDTDFHDQPAMKENVFDVLIYLFEKFMDGEDDERPDTDAVRTDLMEAGFPPAEISKALNWLDSLSQMPDMSQVSLPAFRVFSAAEEAKLDIEGRGLLMFLEQTGILVPESREQVIDRVMALDEDHLSLDNLKWMILMVLFSRPDEDLAFARMEHLVYGSLPATLH